MSDPVDDTCRARLMLPEQFVPSISVTSIDVTLLTATQCNTIDGWGAQTTQMGSKAFHVRPFIKATE